MVFVAVSLPKLARNEGSYYKASLEGMCSLSVKKNLHAENLNFNKNKKV